MRSRAIAAAAVTLSLSAITALGTPMASPATRAASPEPTSRPTIPPLVASGNVGPQAFIVTGYFPPLGTGRLGFRVVRDGGRELVAVYDLADGTPLLLSDGREALVYDVLNDCIRRVPSGRGFVDVAWQPTADFPITLNWACGTFDHESRETATKPSSFRVDQMLDGWADAWMPTEAPVGRRRLALYLPDGKGRAVIETNAGDSSAFTMTIELVKTRTVQFRMDAIYPAAGIATANSNAFPDVRRLASQVSVLQLTPDDALRKATDGSLQSERSMMAKMGLLTGPEYRKEFALLTGTDWADLSKRDATLGQRYRDALKTQGITFPIGMTNATTQPLRQ